MSLMSLTAVELGKKIKAKEVTVAEAVTAALDAIEAKEKKVNSFVTVDREGALLISCGISDPSKYMVSGKERQSPCRSKWHTMHIVCVSVQKTVRARHRRMSGPV